MKIALLAKRNSIHTVKWANSLADRGHEIHLFSMHKGGDKLHEKVFSHFLHAPPPLGYYLNTLHLRRKLAEIRPDLLHVHYASGYGTLGRLTSFHPLILSVWGSDVYEFPKRSPIHKWTIRKNILYADNICSTSHNMANHIKTSIPELEKAIIVPFGVDIEKFNPSRIKNKKTNSVVVGTVKTLAQTYGIDILIRAFAEVVKRCTDTQTSLRLMIVGDGPQRTQLESLACEMGIRNITDFIGRVCNDDVPLYLNQFDIYVAPSREESFGVAVLEASACGIPVVVSNVGGLPEVVKHNRTGLVVPKENIQATTESILYLVSNSKARRRMGNAGRAYVQQNFQWEANVTEMEKIYRRCVGIF